MDTDRRVFAAVNQVRKKAGVPAVEWWSPAAIVAGAHASAMAESDFFSHEDPVRGDLGVRLATAGIRYTRAAENLLQQVGCRDAVACAVEGWTESNGHRRNILNPAFTHSGTGVSSGRNGALYYVQVFVRPVLPQKQHRRERAGGRE